MSEGHETMKYLLREKPPVYYDEASSQEEDDLEDEEHVSDVHESSEFSSDSDTSDFDDNMAQPLPAKRGRRSSIASNKGK